MAEKLSKFTLDTSKKVLKDATSKLQGDKLSHCILNDSEITLKEVIVDDVVVESDTQDEDVFKNSIGATPDTLADIYLSFARGILNGKNKTLRQARENVIDTYIQLGRNAAEKKYEFMTVEEDQIHDDGSTERYIRGESKKMDCVFETADKLYSKINLTELEPPKAQSVEDCHEEVDEMRIGCTKEVKKCIDYLKRNFVCKNIDEDQPTKSTDDNITL